LIDTYVVHARILKDRRRHLESQTKNIAVRLDWIEEADPEDIDTSLEGRWFAGNHLLSPRQMSCSLKHLAALRMVATGDREYALIIEDDAILARDFSSRLEVVAAEFEALGPSTVAYVGAGDNWYVAPSRIKRGQSLYREERSRTTDGYLVTREAARARLDWIAKNRMDKPIGHVFNEVDHATGVAIYWAEPPLLTQGSLTGRFPSAISPKHPRWMQAALFLYKGFVRRNLSSRRK
jgi:glycosyl transferase family 25